MFLTMSVIDLSIFIYLDSIATENFLEKIETKPTFVAGTILALKGAFVYIYYWFSVFTMHQDQPRG